MTAILCPVRGGPESQPTIQRALELAKETSLEVVFLYVVNLDFLTHTASSRSKVITQELTQLGLFILDAAQHRADLAGVASKGEVRHGKVMEQIKELSAEINARYIVLGAPRHEREQNVFERQQMTAFFDHLKSETGAEIVLVEPVADEN
jgi:nucleotide-binding universal stress UspA family protein